MDRLGQTGDTRTVGDGLQITATDRGDGTVTVNININLSLRFERLNEGQNGLSRTIGTQDTLLGDPPIAAARDRATRTIGVQTTPAPLTPMASTEDPCPDDKLYAESLVPRPPSLPEEVATSVWTAPQTQALMPQLALVDRVGQVRFAGGSGEMQVNPDWDWENRCNKSSGDIAKSEDSHLDHEEPSITESEFRLAWQRAHNGRACGPSCTHPSMPSIQASVLDFLARHGHAWNVTEDEGIHDGPSTRAMHPPDRFEGDSGTQSSARPWYDTESQLGPPREPSPIYPRLRGPLVIDGLVYVSDSEEEP